MDSAIAKKMLKHPPPKIEFKMLVYAAHSFFGFQMRIGRLLECIVQKQKSVMLCTIPYMTEHDLLKDKKDIIHVKSCYMI